MRGVDDLLTVDWLRENFEVRGRDVYWRVQSDVGRGRDLTKPAGYTNAKGYRLIRVNVFGQKTQVYAHRVAFTLSRGHWPRGHIDHEDGDPGNNDPRNLRDVTRAENNKNKRIGRNNTSGHAGVHFDAHSDRWRVSLGKGKRLSSHRTLVEALAARKTAEVAAGYHPNHGRA